MMVLTLTGCTGSPSVAMIVSTCPSTLNWAGHTVPKELISRNLYLLPGVIVNTSTGVLVRKPVLGSWKIVTLCEHNLAICMLGPLPHNGKNTLRIADSGVLETVDGHR